VRGRKTGNDRKYKVSSSLPFPKAGTIIFKKAGAAKFLIVRPAIYVHQNHTANRTSAKALFQMNV